MIRSAPAAIQLSPDNLYIFSLKQRRQIPFKLQRALHSHPENTRGNIYILASHKESESTEIYTMIKNQISMIEVGLWNLQLVSGFLK